ncbi:hypothetical protein GPX-Vietnam_023 [Goatpox virus]|uniref:Uncharacterized protein n=2 Tax=Goatpox virus TaxID=186805 RepID=A0A1B2LPV6_9POXV|nr:Hypothetical protein GTPV_gp020 [Goatpox virus Pellor]AGZ95338.1 hypothetical protein [Goatpox virus FZ]AOA32981.1 hypothetical protein GTPV_gp020 [Goatpox virus]QEJ78722.1 hypothetical protein GPX-India_023 [Goatpox virus]QEJ78872.1 hypothetical protein GPX-Vietnam_023 [Goatpox virus]QOK36460.1 hypothetical protein [Goatpox virus]
MSEKLKKVNKVVVNGKPYNSNSSNSSPSKDEIKKYGYCLNIKKPSSYNDKKETYLHNDYPMVITTNTSFYDT